MLTQYTDCITRFLQIRKGTNLSSYTKLYGAFLISGIFHALSQLQMPSPVNISAHERTVGFFLFFVWQMVAITIEDFVQWFIRALKFQRLMSEEYFLKRFVGWAWVTLVMWKGLPLAGDTFLRMRMGVEPMMPVSFSRSLVEKWVPVPP